MLLLTKSVTSNKECEAHCRSDIAHVELGRNVGNSSSVNGRSNVDSERQKTCLEHDPCLP